MTAYYNEIDPYCAQWLRNLIAAGLIAPGDVDERDIRDVRPDDLRGYVQCHFFAGIGVWSAALRGAGWPDDRSVWTGSCPCQPFSAAGQGGGFADERHLWPAFFHLIDECRPRVVFGEQVASKDGLAWLDLVQADLEGSDYAVGALDLCAAGVGAPHIRQRLWWVAQPNHAERRATLAGWNVPYWPTPRRNEGDGEPREYRQARELADAGVQRQHRGEDVGTDRGNARESGAAHHRRATGLLEPQRDRTACELVNASRPGGRRDAGAVLGAEGEGPRSGSAARRLTHELVPSGFVGGSWADADWIFCRDGKYRPVEPGTFPLAHGVPGRVGKLCGAGNAIVPQVAAEFIGAYLTVEHDVDLRLSGGVFA